MTEILSIPMKNAEHMLGKFPTEENYNRVVTSDTDLYRETPDGVQDESNIIFKFRKNVFSTEEVVQAHEGLIKAATETQNRGIAAGPRGDTIGGRDFVKGQQMAIMDAMLDASESSLEEEHDAIDHAIETYREGQDTRGIVWLSEKIKKAGYEYSTFFDTWLETVRPFSVAERKVKTKEMMKTFISDTTYANTVHSGIAGWFDRYPRIPFGRATSFTEANPELFKKSYPYLQTLSNTFGKLLPQRFAKQKAFTDAIDPAFVVPETAYTTITVNKTFQTACHRDAGDYTEGFSNITCLSPDGTKTWEGCLFVLPEYDIAIELHPGDLLLVNNHDGIHGNTKITDGTRVSVVAYAREKMALLGSFEYESLRKQYVEDRRKNKDHPLQRHLWNGVSPGMWDEDEWFQYLEQHGGTEMLNKYHEKKVESSLEAFF